MNKNLHIAFIFCKITLFYIYIYTRQSKCLLPYCLSLYLGTVLKRNRDCYVAYILRNMSAKAEVILVILENIHPINYIQPNTVMKALPVEG